MNTAHKSYRFCIEPDAPIATLESALAIVRRLGIELLGLRSITTTQGLDVLLRLAAPADDTLTLCRMRLHNVIGIQAIREVSAPVKLVLRAPPVESRHRAAPWAGGDSAEPDCGRLAPHLGVT